MPIQKLIIQRSEIEVSIARAFKHMTDTLDGLQAHMTDTLDGLKETFSQTDDRLDRNNSLMQSVQKTLLQISKKLNRQDTIEARVRVLQAKVFGPERGPVVEICAGFSSGARSKYAQANTWGT